MKLYLCPNCKRPLHVDSDMGVFSVTCTYGRCDSCACSDEHTGESPDEAHDAMVDAWSHEMAEKDDV